MSQLRSVWHEYLETRIQQQNIPVPGLSQESIQSLSASQLEQYVRGALRMRKNWKSPSPVATRRLEVPTLPTSRVVSLEFLPGKERRWLISLSLTVESTRTFTCQCWDLCPTQSKCIATKEFQRFGSFAVNRDAGSSGHLAIQHTG
jgi:hypothetical protein